MKILLSPTKKQIIGANAGKYSNPFFTNKSLEIMSILKDLKKEDLISLFGISDKLAEENFKRNQIWSVDKINNNGTNAIFTYSGEAFSSLNPNSFSISDLDYADEHLFILSGLYGILKPLDIIMPYRLDIKDKIYVPNYKSLYDFWINDITNYLIKNLTKSEYLLNLSSMEYSKSIDFSRF